MQCTNPLKLTNSQKVVSCGRCRACRIRRSHDWCLRMTNELHTQNYNAMFITLSYDDKHLPVFKSLIKSDVQKFFKRLRKEIDFKIKYYVAGEYGDKKTIDYYMKKYGRPFGRPHYHAIIFGMSYLDDKNHKAIIECWPMCDWKEMLSTRRGQKAIGTVTKDSMLYTTKYIQKKFYNRNINKIFQHYGYCNPEFQLQSQGIGKDWFNLKKKEITQEGKVYYKGQKVNPPRYYFDKVKEDIPLEKRMENSCEAYANMLEKGLNVKYIGTSEETEQRLCQIDINLKAKEQLKKDRQNINSGL